MTPFTEAHAVDLLDRLEDCGLADGLTEEDLSGGSPPREPLRTTCAQLAQRVWALRHVLPILSHTSLQRAVLDLGAAAETEAASRGGALDAALCQLATALDAGWQADGGKGRLVSLGLVVGVMQAAALLPGGSASPPAAEGTGEGVGDVEHVAAAAGAGADAAGPSTDRPTVAVSSALRALGRLVGADAGGASAAALAEAAAGRVECLASSLPAGFFEPLLPQDQAGDALRDALHDVDAALRAEYVVRRAMLKERASVTLRALLWSERLGEEDRAACGARVEAALAAMPTSPAVTLHDVHVARLGDLFGIMDSATSGARSGGAVKAVRIGQHQHRQKRFKQR